jgi:hypothetical protein
MPGVLTVGARRPQAELLASPARRWQLQEAASALAEEEAPPASPDGKECPELPAVPNAEVGYTRFTGILGIDISETAMPPNRKVRYSNERRFPTAASFGCAVGFRLEGAASIDCVAAGALGTD